MVLDLDLLKYSNKWITSDASILVFSFQLFVLVMIKGLNQFLKVELFGFLNIIMTHFLPYKVVLLLILSSPEFLT